MKYIKSNFIELIVAIIVFIVLLLSFSITVKQANRLSDEVETLRAEKMQLQYKLHQAETSNYLLIRELGK